MDQPTVVGGEQGNRFHLDLLTEPAQRAHAAPPVCVEPESTVRSVMEQLGRNNRGAVLICRDGVLVGIFTERDALRLMASGADLDVPMERVMTREPATLHKSDSMATAIARMSKGGYRRMPIVDEQGRPQGVVKVSGILHYLVEHFPSVIYTLPPEPDTRPQEREGA